MRALDRCLSVNRSLERAAALAAKPLAVAVLSLASGALNAADEPWADDPAVQTVLAQRQRGIEAMMSGTMSADTERYSTTFVANTPSNRVVPGEEMLKLFATGNLRYAHVEQHIEYAGSHGPDIVVLMGEEVVVAGEGAANAGQRIHRRFTDVFRRENGEWRHDLRHANVVSIE